MTLTTRQTPNETEDVFRDGLLIGEVWFSFRSQVWYGLTTSEKVHTADTRDEILAWLETQ